MSRIQDASITADGFDVTVGGTDDNDPEHMVRLSLVNPNCHISLDFEPAQFVALRDLINDQIGELFLAYPDIRCPCCGYTETDADVQLDHRHCRNFPFFPGETGKSHAIADTKYVRDPQR